MKHYLSALDEEKPDILGMSALFTTTMPYMKVVIEELGNKGIRDDLIVLVGGAPLNEEFSQAIGEATGQLNQTVDAVSGQISDATDQLSDFLGNS